MADETRKAVMSVIITEDGKLSDLPISSESQLIFIKQKSLIALDFKGVRNFFRGITTLEKDEDRQTIEPTNGSFYFVTNTCILWVYEKDQWHKLTGTTDETVYIGIDKPAVGVEGKLYVSKTDKNINVWDDGSSDYICVGEKNEYASPEDIRKMFD